MQKAMGKSMAGISMTAIAMMLAGCGSEQCDQFGTHMAGVVFEEAKAAGQDVAEEKRAEIAKRTAEACAADPPGEAELACALKASSTKAMKKCEGVDEDADNKDKG
ncbi:MAG: hypothetical protein JKY37_03175 [Nannocystaceae bacterium]|nr:hypothetical protein [Nannocystaceae bacterium]